ncbi:MAG: recombinase family protein [Cyanobacteriota bacterium]|nr:recombinase family protein [Cyanobacteriota bacterium]
MTGFSEYKEIIAYSRYSSRQQARGTSEARQLDAVAAFATVHGLTLSNRIDRGLSGFHGTNLHSGALGTLIAELRAGAIPTPALLLVERQDRFGRRPTTQTLLTLFADLLGQGCDLYHLHQQRLYTEAIINSDFGALVTLAAEIHSAHHYSSTLSQRSAVAHEKSRQRMKDGEAVRIGWAPSWLTHTAGGWHFTPYAATIQRLLELLDSGLGYIATAKALNAEGLLSPRGKPWTAGGVNHILQSPAVAGGRTMRRRAEVIWDYFPALLDQQAWHGLLAKVAARNADYSTPSTQDQCHWIGQGLTTCAVCGRMVGSRMCSWLQRSTGIRHRQLYVRCRGRLDGDCQEPALPLLEVAAHLLTRLQPAQLQQILDQGSSDQVSHLQRQVAVLQQRCDGAQAAVRAAEAEIAKLLAAGEAATAVVLGRQVPDLEQRVKDAQLELQEAASTLEGLTNRPSLVALGAPVKTLQQAFAMGSDTAEQRRAVNAAMRRLGVTVCLQSSKRLMGLAIGDAPLQWQPLSSLDRAALWDGVTGWNSGRDGALTVEPQLVG